jgi:hypothetical protein
MHFAFKPEDLMKVFARSFFVFLVLSFAVLPAEAQKTKVLDVAIDKQGSEEFKKYCSSLNAEIGILFVSPKALFNPAYHWSVVLTDTRDGQVAVHVQATLAAVQNGRTVLRSQYGNAKLSMKVPPKDQAKEILAAMLQVQKKFDAALAPKPNRKSV